MKKIVKKSVGKTLTCNQFKEMAAYYIADLRGRQKWLMEQGYHPQSLVDMEAGASGIVNDIIESAFAEAAKKIKKKPHDGEAIFGRAAAAAVTAERERCAKIAEKWTSTPHIKLHAGEMTAQETRTVKAVAASIAASIRAGK